MSLRRCLHVVLVAAALLVIGMDTRAQRVYFAEKQFTVIHEPTAASQTTTLSAGADSFKPPPEEAPPPTLQGASCGTIGPQPEDETRLLPGIRTSGPMQSRSAVNLLVGIISQAVSLIGTACGVGVVVGSIQRKSALNAAVGVLIVFLAFTLPQLCLWLMKVRLP